jgi:outer membrane protein TolC
MQHTMQHIRTTIIAICLSLLSLTAQESDSLNLYLEIAGRNNPGLNADFLTYKSSLEKVHQAGAWSDPTIEIGFFLKPMDIVGGRQIADITLMQMFPWFGTKKAAQTEAIHMAKMAYEKFRETRDNLYLEVYTQWYLLSTLEEQLNNNRENLELLKQLEQLAIRKVSSPLSSSSSSYSLPVPAPTTKSIASSQTAGSMSGMGSMSTATSSSESTSSGMSGMGSTSGMSSGMSNTSPGMSDVLRIQLEMAEIESNIESILSEIEAEKAKFNSLLNRPLTSNVALQDSITKVVFHFDEKISMQEIEQQNPMLGMLEEEEMAYKAKGEMDKKMSYPMFGIGLQYMLIGGNKTTMMDQEMTPKMNGMDMVMPMVSVSLPLYRNKYKAQQRESRYQWQAAREKYKSTLNQLHSDLFKQKQQLDNAERRILLYQKQEKLARTAYQLLLQEYVSAKTDLTNVIQVQRQLLEYQLRRTEAIAEYNTKVANIQKLQSFNRTNN